MLNVSKNKCIGCGVCENECPAGAVFVNEKTGVAELSEERCINCCQCIENCPQNAIKNIEGKLFFAIGTDDAETIKPDDHVGMSKYFQIWKYSNGKIDLTETRENAKYKEDETKTHGDPGKAKATASVLDGVDVLIGKRIGPNIKRLKNKFVPAIIREKKIEKAVEIIQDNINEIIEMQERKPDLREGLILR
jgi:MinD superfamily P-loop ATPase